MNKLISIVAMATAVQAQTTADDTTTLDDTTASVECLNCKLKDAKSAWTYTYSFCQKTDLCLADEWNYINAWCPSKWIPGWMLDIDEHCGSEDKSEKCLPLFTNENQVTVSDEYSLPKGGQCTIYIDATKSMARVRFNKGANLGVLFTGYKDGEPITIPKGEKQSVTVYNGDLRLPVSFEVTISSAVYLSAVAALSTVAASTLF